MQERSRRHKVESSRHHLEEISLPRIIFIAPLTAQTRENERGPNPPTSHPLHTVVSYVSATQHPPQVMFHPRNDMQAHGGHTACGRIAPRQLYQDVPFPPGLLFEDACSTPALRRRQQGHFFPLCWATRTASDPSLMKRRRTLVNRLK